MEACASGFEDGLCLGSAIVASERVFADFFWCALHDEAVVVCVVAGPVRAGAINNEDSGLVFVERVVGGGGMGEVVVDDEGGSAFKCGEESVFFGEPCVALDGADGSGFFDHGVGAELIHADAVELGEADSGLGEDSFDGEPWELAVLLASAEAFFGECAAAEGSCVFPNETGTGVVLWAEFEAEDCGHWRFIVLLGRFSLKSLW